MPDTSFDLKKQQQHNKDLIFRLVPDFGVLFES